MNKRFTFLSVFLSFGLLLASATISLAQPVFSIQNKKDACDNLANGSFQILVTSGTGTISGFVFSSGAPIGPINLTVGVPQTVSGLSGLPAPAGTTYLIVVADDNGNAIALTTIFLYPTINPSVVSSSNSTSCTTPDGAIDINVTGGSGSYIYAWTGPNGFTATTQDISGLSGGNYSLVISDPATTCTQSVGPIVISDPTPPSSATLNVAGSNVICNNGQSTTLSVTIVGGVSPYTVSISGLPVINNYVSGTPIAITPLVTTSYSLLSVTAANGCDALVLNGNPTITVNNPVNAGLNNSVLACNNESAFNLFSSLGGTPDTGGSWLQLSGAPRTITANTVDLNGAPAGVYTFEYKVLGPVSCPDATAVVTITVTAASNAGIDNTVNACNTETAFNLFTSLGGTPQAGGAWTQLSGPARTLTGNTVNLVGATAGAYTFEYKVLGTAPCPDATAVVTVNVSITPDAGLNNTVSACNSETAFDLFTSLAGTPQSGGTWIQLTGPVRTITGNTVDLNGAAAGAYTFRYTIAGTAPCADATAVITVNIIAAPNAGTNNTVAACNTETAFNLFTSLLGTPQNGGTWTQLSGAARTITGNTVNLVGATAGAYTFQYVVTGTAPCANASSVVTVNVAETPNAGANNTVNACNTESAFDLFVSLSGTPQNGGTWIQLTGPVRTITGNTVDLNGAAAGVYTFRYTIAGTAPCADATAVVTVNVIAAPNAGTNNTVAACNIETAFNLFTSLAGTPENGGTWTQLSGPARTISGNTVNLVGATAGAYTFQYVVTGTAPCANASSVVTVNVAETPNAGANNTVNTCNIDPAFNLFASLAGAPQNGGTWIQLTGPARTITGNTVDFNGATPGIYTFQYTVTGTAPCPAASAIVTVNVSPAPNAGVDNTVSSCNTEAAFNLFTSLGGTPQAGGVWTQLTGPARTITGNTVSLIGATAGNYTFEYTVTGVAPCADASAVVTINVAELPDAGANNSVNACNSDSAFNLFTSLAGTPDAGGIWTQLTGPSLTITGENVNLIGATAGVYTFQYRVIGVAPCPDATAVVTLNITATASAGSDNSVIACNTDAAFNLFTSLGGTPQAGGTWIQVSGALRTITGNTVNLIGAAAGTYAFQYRVIGTAPCPDDTAIITVDVSAAPNAGLNNTVDACNTDPSFNLFTSLNGTPESGGIWTQLSGPARTITGNTVDLNGAATGAYDFQYTVSGTAPCANASAIVTIQVGGNPDNSLNLSVSISPVCVGGSSDIVVANSEVGVSYQLRNDADNSLVGTPVVGNGASILLPTGPLTTTTNFNVLATRAQCSIQMLNIRSVTVFGIIDPTLQVVAQAPAICEGTSTNIQIINSEAGVQYQLRDDSNNALVGTQVAGTGGTINLPTGNLTATTTFNVLAFSIGFCTIELNNTVSIQVDINPNTSLGVSSLITDLCVNGSTVILISASQSGVNYQLRNNLDNSLIGTPVAGTGGVIALPTGTLNTTTTFNILAISGACTPVQLVNTVIINVSGSINLTLTPLALAPSLCAGNNTFIQIENSEVGVNYQLIDNADNSLVPGVVAGTGATILLPTGVLNTSKVYRVLVTNATCSAELPSTVSVTVTPFPSDALTLTATGASVCEGNSTTVQVVNSEAGTIYQLRDDADDSIVSGSVFGTGGDISLPTGVLTTPKTFNVLATNGTCSVELINKISFTIDLPPSPLPGVLAQSTQVCAGSGTFIQVLNTEPGIIYQLRNNADNSLVSGAVFGNGGTINLPTGPITQETTYNVIASNSLCSIQLTDIITVTLRAANDPACSNCSSVVISTNTTQASCGPGVTDGTVTFVIDPPVPTVNIIGVRIQITGPVSVTQLNNFEFTDLPAGNYSYVVTYGDENNPACIKNGTFEITAVREPEPIAFDLVVDEYNCITLLGSITLDNIAGAANTDFGFIISDGSSTISQGSITVAQSLNPFQIQDLPIGNYDIQLTQNQEPSNGCIGLISSQAISFTIAEPAGGCEIFIPNIFTPNADGSNDTFFIRHLPANSSVFITNRWGKEVYSSSDYQNDWTADNISDGVYYFKVVAEGKSYTGWVEILR
jgi:gliding motility-associated-like protein